eukprot:6214567-Pleurochrysis_carterae.AAC.5
MAAARHSYEFANLCGTVNIARLALSPDGVVLLAIDDEGSVLLANVKRRVVVAHLNLKQRVADAKFSPDGKWVAFAIGRLVQAKGACEI